MYGNLSTESSFVSTDRFGRSYQLVESGMISEPMMS